MQVKLSEYARLMGVTYQTAQNWWHGGRIDGAYKTPSGSIFVKIENNLDKTNPRIVVYARVSNQSRKNELNYQVQRCLDYASAKGYQVENIYSEVASGMNDSRKQLWKMLESKPDIIIVENKDRLTRFGFNYIDKLSNSVIEVISPKDNDENDLMKDLVSIITSFCCRLYGLRRTKSKVNKIKELVHCE